MVFDKEFLTIQGKIVKLKSFGTYAALCTNCDSNYVGQTKTVSVIDGQLIELLGIN